jgi:adenylosuccinate synthase
MSTQTNVLPIRPIQGVSAPLTIIISEKIDHGVANLVQNINVPNLLLTTTDEYPALRIDERKADIYLSIDVTAISQQELALLIEKFEPTQIVVHKLEVMFERDYKKTTWLSLSAKARDFINHLQEITRTPITMIGTSPMTMVDIR